MTSSPNRDRLVRTARLLRPLLGEFVFVGGQVAELLVTDASLVRARIISLHPPPLQIDPGGGTPPFTRRLAV
jgi:hypothetical protein